MNFNYLSHFLVVLALVYVVFANPHDIRETKDPHSILKGFNTIGEGVTALDNVIKAYDNKTEPRVIRTLTYNVEMSIMRTTNDVLWIKELNEKDSKAITAANQKMKGSLQTLLRDMTAKKDPIKKAKQVGFIHDNFENLHKRCFPLADALEDKITDPDSKDINRAIDEVDKSFEQGLKELH